MAIRPVFFKAVRSQIDWPIVGLAVAMAVVLVLSTTLAAWVASRSASPISRAAGSPIGFGESEAAAMQSVGDARSHAESGNEEVVQQVPAASYPEGDQQAVASGASRSNGSTGYARVRASPSRTVAKGQQGNEVEPANARSCQQGENELHSQLAFAKDPAEAAELAKREHKLMFVLHVSGNFEESKFT
jgi:hypothetical protein